MTLFREREPISMHMADALLAPAVAATMYAVSTVTAGASIVKLNREEKLDHESAAKSAWLLSQQYLR